MLEKTVDIGSPIRQPSLSRVISFIKNQTSMKRMHTIGIDAFCRLMNSLVYCTAKVLYGSIIVAVYSSIVTTHTRLPILKFTIMNKIIFAATSSPSKPPKRNGKNESSGAPADMRSSDLTVRQFSTSRP